MKNRARAIKKAAALARWPFLSFSRAARAAAAKLAESREEKLAAKAILNAGIWSLRSQASRAKLSGISLTTWLDAQLEGIADAKLRKVLQRPWLNPTDAWNGVSPAMAVALMPSAP